MHQKILARSRSEFQSARVELTPFVLGCFSINGTCDLDNAGPDATFVFTVSFEIPPPEGLLLQGEYHSNFEDEIHIRHAASGTILATLNVKAIWDLTPDHLAVFFRSMPLPMNVSHCQSPSVLTKAIERISISDKSKLHPAAADTSDVSRRPQYDEVEHAFYQSLLTKMAARGSNDALPSECISAPKNYHAKISADDTVIYSNSISSVKSASGCEEAKQPKLTKATVQFEGDCIIVIDGIKYDTWGNIISDAVENNKSQRVQNSASELPSCDTLLAKKKLPHLGATTIRGSNVPSVAASATTPCNEHETHRYLDILDGNLVPEIHDKFQVPDCARARRGSTNLSSGSQSSSMHNHGIKPGIKSGTTSSLSHHTKLHAFSAPKCRSQISASLNASISTLKSEDEFNDAWDSL